MVEQSQQNKRMHPVLNSTFLQLIPKTDHLEEPQGFRPITLYNVIYKIMATIMVNHLKPMLPRLISQEYTNFLKGRQIVDGILTAQEVIHSLKSQKDKGMMIKLDLLKAYDRLSWNYLQGILNTFGLDPKWINWIYSMISTHMFSILLNGAPMKDFNATMGLRQGDPMSLFLLILAAEGLGRYVKEKVQDDQFRVL